MSHPIPWIEPDNLLPEDTYDKESEGPAIWGEKNAWWYVRLIRGALYWRIKHLKWLNSLTGAKKKRYDWDEDYEQASYNDYICHKLEEHNLRTS